MSERSDGPDPARLAGVRVIECSMLGPGAITTAPRRPRRRRDQGRAAAGRLRPPDDVADRRGRVADAPPHQPRQAQRHARPAHRRGPRRLPRARARGRRRGRGDAPRRARAARARLRPAARGQPADRVHHDLRLRHDRALQGHAEPRHRLRHLGRPRHPEVDDDGFTYIPEHPSIGIHAGPALRRARHPRRHHPGPRDGRAAAASRSRSPTPPPPWTGTAPRRGRPTSGPSPRSPATSPTTTSAARPAPAGMREGVRYQIYESTDGHVLFMASEREFWQNFCDGRRPHGPLRALAGREVRRPRAAATSSCRPSCANLPRPGRRPSGSRSATSTTRRSRR